MRSLAVICLFLFTTTVAQNRVDVLECRTLFPFEPLTGRYEAQSAARAATFINGWKGHGREFQIRDSLSIGYKIYDDLVDSTLDDRVWAWIGVKKAPVDSIVDTLDLRDFPVSSQFMRHFESEIQRIKRFFATPIAELEHSVEFDYYRPSELSAIFHQFQMESSRAQVSFFAPPTPDVILGPEIFINTVFDLFYFDNQLVVVNLSGRQIKTYLEEVAADRYFQTRKRESKILKPTTPYYRHISVSGIEMRINLTKTRGQKIEAFSLPMDSVVRVVMNSFQAQRFDADAESLGDYKMQLIKWLIKQHRVTPKISEQWKLIPESWVKMESESL